MKNIFNKIFLTTCLLISLGCGDFGDLNVDPNNPTVVAPETLLTNALTSVSSYVGATQGVLYSQMIGQITYTEDSRYEITQFDFSSWYYGPLNDLERIIDLNTDEETRVDANISGSNANQIAVARILKAYFYHTMTDRWGPIPYSQALQGNENFEPAYDSQEAIYTDLFKELTEAVAQMDSGAGVAGDFLFNGDMNSWKRFANSLRMVMAMRISNVDAAEGQKQFEGAMGADGGYISNNAESVMYPYLASAVNANPWFTRFITREDWGLSEPLVAMLDNLNDPRKNSFGDGTRAGDNPGSIVGIPYGMEFAVDANEISLPNGQYVRAQDAPLPIMTAAQMLFTRAEAAVRGWTGEDAEALYYDAIRASMEQWNVYEETAFDSYIQQANVAWDSANAMELIGNQKWIGLFLQGYEGWAEWRRTGYPALVPAIDPLNESGQIPVRQGYPTSENDLNKANYDAGVALLGGADNLDTPLWWDK